MDFFGFFGNLPGPIKGLVMVASGASVVSIASLFSDQYRPLGIWVLVGVAAVALVVILYKLFLYMREKSKSGPFSKLLSKGSGSGALSPEEKARQDQVRQKFEEGVEIYRKAGKDLYSLPWFMLVGPAGSGKTEAIRRSSVPFPSGLQDQLQGVGGTINMHWWFTNNAVVLDTAGALFMGGLDGPRAGEWKEFLKLLKKTRTNCPTNGLLLVISSESLLKDSNEKIEQAASIIARQLDLIQRTLDVRFPVNIVITKCDKIVGFREFFETLNDPVLQHQILGWTNPAPLDEAFRPDSLEKHLESVRQKLIRRRLGLIQNPIHTVDPTSRRTDQVDEMFELPDNFARIGPRLRRYLELVFVAGEWSPKPLFLRGIYFTSSMRQGQVLDMALASALGMDAESLPTGRQWDEERAYFLRDVFLSKVFPEKGLVTRATNVGKQITTQRRVIAIGSIAAMLVVAGFAVFGWMGFKSTLDKPAAFWRRVSTLVAGNKDDRHDAAQLALLGIDPKDPTKVLYLGNDDIDTTGDLPENVEKRAQLLIETGRQAPFREEPPAIAKPIGWFLGFSDGFVERKTNTHRAMVESYLLGPLARESRSKLIDEDSWSPEAVATLAQLVRVQTYAFGEKPSEGKTGGLVGDMKDRIKGDKAAAPAVDLDPMMQYVLGEETYKRPDGYQVQAKKLVDAISKAYPNGFGGDVLPGAAFAAKEKESVDRVSESVDQFIRRASDGDTPDIVKLKKLRDGATAFRDAENGLLNIQWLKSASGGAVPANPKDVAEYDRFAAQYVEQMQKLRKAKEDIDAALAGLGGPLMDPVTMVRQRGDELKVRLDGYFEQLLNQLPGGGGLGVEVTGKADKVADKAEDLFSGPPELSSLRDKLADNRGKVATAVAKTLGELEQQFKSISPILVAGKAGSKEAPAYSVRFDAYDLALKQIHEVANASGATDASSARAFGVRTKQMDDAAAESLGNVEGLGSWTANSDAVKPLDADQQRAVATDRDAAIQASRRVVGIAQGRRLRALAQDAVENWYKNKDEMGADVAAVADKRLTEAAPGFKRWPRPPVPLSDFESGGDFKSEYHPEAAKEVLGGWGNLSELAEASSQNARWMLGGLDLARTPEYDAAKRVAEAYGQDYMDYWKRQATEDSRAAAKSWADYTAKIKQGERDSINRALKALRDRVNEAVEAVPANFGTREWYRRGKDEIVGAFKGLDSPTFGNKAQQTLKAWQDLAKDVGGSESVRTKLRTSFSDGVLKNTYFRVHATPGDPDYVAYWNSLPLNGLETLVAETQPKLAQARQALLSADGIPLGLGGNGAKDLTPDQVRAIKIAADDLGSANAGKGGTDAAAGDELPPDVLALVETLAGKTFIDRDERTRTWFRQLREVLTGLVGKGPMEVTISPAIDAGLPAPRGTTGGDARDLGFARIYVGGNLVGRAFPTDKAPLAELAPELKAAIPMSAPMEIRLYRNDPRGGDPAPDGVVTLGGPWGLLRKMLTEGGQSVSKDDGTWNVALTTDDGKYWWWVNLKFNTKLPPKDQWPTLDRWPKE